MMRSSQIWILSARLAIMLVALPYGLEAQISPGDLTSAHAQFEGVANCTKCHELGDKVTNAKCLDCHKEIKTRMDANKGYHATAAVRTKDCFSCHSEHHGRSFEIVRFDKKTFDHRQTGYPLTGAHARTDCASCHKSEWVKAPDVRSKKKTYLGLSTDCVTCHKDVHQATLKTDCAACHTTEAFAPASKFDHAKTAFPLRGQHQQVDCASCHKETTRAGQPYQEFAGVAFSSCASCHTDPHQDRLGTECKTCHVEESFLTFSGKSSFNHSKTSYPLQGRHKRVDCAACHRSMQSSTATTVFREFEGKDVAQCATCHKDVHEGKFGQACQQCHTVESFQKILHTDQFDHRLTGWPLEGRHAPVDCKKCHAERLTDPVAHARCMDCHADFHEGQFVAGAQSPDCASCHTVGGFEESTYGIERHNAGEFPLTGAHLATPCFACHREDGKTWAFRDIGSRCADCHDDIHAGSLDTRYYPGKDCAQCHTADTWTATGFDHDLTAFKLVGKHAQTDCIRCHQPEPDKKTTEPVRFKGIGQTCAECHDNIHGRQFDEEGVTACADCHTPEGWSPSLFDHSLSRFPLEGKHVGLACAECHKPEEEDGQLIIRYATGRIACADCHK
jgi:hypothetical protein